jgi:hypothetical protein
MTTTLYGAAVATTDQENTNPSIDMIIIANVCSTFWDVRAAYNDGLVKEIRE